MVVTSTTPKSLGLVADNNLTDTEEEQLEHRSIDKLNWKITNYPTQGETKAEQFGSENSRLVSSVGEFYKIDSTKRQRKLV